MGKARKWIRNFLLGKKEKETENYQTFSVMENIDHRPTTPISTTTSTTPKEKRRWSFRRSSATAPAVQKELNFTDDSSENIIDHKKHGLAVAVATAAAADAAAAAAKAAAAVFQLTAVVTAAASSPSGRESAYYEEAAVIKIQSAFRGYLARMALNALKGLVKLQALIRAHLVRKQASATLRCMQALVTAQERARAQRIQMVQDAKFNNHNQSNDGKSSKENRFKHSNQEFDKAMEEHIKIVEMDVGENKKGISRKSRSSCSSYGQQQTHRITTDHRMSTHSSAFSSHQEQDHHHHHYHQTSPSPSPSINDLSPKARSGHFEEYTLYTAQSSPQQQHYYSETIISSKHDDLAVPPVPPYARSELGDSYYTEYPFYPSYMANTQSSRAKVRSHSAPKQRPEMFERQLSRRNRPSIEGRNVPRAVKMQRSSSHVGQNYQYPWSSVKLDKSNMSLKDSECGSNYTVLTNNTNWIRGN